MEPRPPPQLVETPFCPDGYLEVDRDGVLVRFNRRALELYGLSDREVDSYLTAPAQTRTPALLAIVRQKVADPETYLAALQRHWSVPSEVVFDFFELVDGRVLERYGVPLRDADGMVTGRAAYVRDVTLRQREGQGLREQAERSAALAELGELALHAEDLDALQLLAVRLLETTLRADVVHYLGLVPEKRHLVLRHVNVAEGHIGREPISIDAGSMSGYTLACGTSVVSSELANERRFTAPRLRSVGLRSGITTIVRGREQPHGILGAFWRRPRSFTPEEVRFHETVASVLAGALTRADAENRLLEREREARAMQSRLALADRMASVGTLAAGVAHELNNPLSYVVANLAFVTESLERARSAAPDGRLADELGDAVREAREGAARMRAIIRDLKTFTRVEDRGAGPVDLPQVLESCIAMAWNEIKHRARFVRDYAEVPAVRGNAGRVGQVFLNLLVNAAQSIREGAADRNEIRLVTREAPGGRVIVEVRDSGCGIAPGDLGRIFDPFFTTKPVGEGTGLGLTICHNIVSAEGGAIEVESVVGQGSCFRVILAAAAGLRLEAETPVATPPPGGRRGRVLIVDDEPLVGAALRRALTAEHEVTVVHGATQALERLEREPFDVVVSDLLMPELTGMDLFAELTRRRPELAARMVFVTGGAFTPAAREFVEAHRDRCLEKPFEVGLLRQLVRKHLDG